MVDRIVMYSHGILCLHSPFDGNPSPPHGDCISLRGCSRADRDNPIQQLHPSKNLRGLCEKKSLNSPISARNRHENQLSTSECNCTLILRKHFDTNTERIIGLHIFHYHTGVRIEKYVLSRIQL